MLKYPVMNQSINPDDYVITRKRKLYKFAAFRMLPNCYDESEWQDAKVDVLNNAHGLTVEVGAGTALFLSKLAAANPDRTYLAIDRKSDRLYKGAKWASEQKVNNISYLWSEARNLSTILPAGTVENLWITFPDPWPQESNIKHRLTNQAFLAEYHRLLKPGGVLEFKTDNTLLFDWSVEQFGSKLWRVEHLTHDLHGDDMASSDAKIMTTYEARYVSEGKTINYLRAVAK